MRRFTMLLVATGIAGLSVGVASAHDVRAPRGCSTIEVTAPGLKRQPRNLRFLSSQILDLEFETRFDRPHYGDHVLRFKVFTPSGFLYQDLTVPFTWPRPKRWPWRKDAATEDTEAVRVASFPSGLPVQQLGDAAPHWRRRHTVQARLPVAGTSITMSTLYGRWTVQAYLDDQTRPCSPPRRFRIHGK